MHPRKRHRQNGRVVAALTGVLLLPILLSVWARAENWPAWRGPSGTGISDEKDLPVKWAKNENVFWRVPLPDRGNSTPVIWNDRVFITQATDKDHRRSVMCFGRVEGKLLWQSGVTWAEHEPTNGQNPYCSSSPVTDGRRVIACFGSPGVYCYDMDGKELWHRDLGKVDSWHGAGSSPVLHQNLCIVNFGPGSNAALVALNKESGEVVWKVAPPQTGFGGFAMGGAGPLRPDPDGPARHAKPAAFDSAAMDVDMSGTGGFAGSWSTPLILHEEDHDELLVAHAMLLAAYDPSTGKRLWSCKGLPVQMFASPAVGQGIAVVCGKEMFGGTTVMAVKLGGSGDVTSSHRLWQTRLPKNCVGSPVIAAGQVDLVTEFGSVVCLDLASGKKQWEKRLSGQGTRGGSWSSFVLAGDRLLLPNQSGEVFILKASPQYQLLQVNSIGEETTCASLAVSDGQLFLRTYEALWCLGRPHAQRAR